MQTISDLLSNPLYLTAFIAAIIVIGLVLTFKQRRFPYYACDTLLTPAELKFYKVLKMAVPRGTHICMKVRMGDIINCDEKAWAAGWGPRVSAKHIDFVLIDAETAEIKMAIELDDSTHRNNQDRIDRDKFVNKAFDVAGMPLLRVPVSKWYDVEELRNLII
jgi:hypothetical protein